MKKGILVVSFGTSHTDTMEKTIQAMEEDIAEAFPEYIVRRAFTSRMILRKLKKEKGIAIDTVEEALARMASEAGPCRASCATESEMSSAFVPGRRFAAMFAADFRRCESSIQIRDVFHGPHQLPAVPQRGVGIFQDGICRGSVVICPVPHQGKYLSRRKLSLRHHRMNCFFIVVRAA